MDEVASKEKGVSFSLSYFLHYNYNYIILYNILYYNYNSKYCTLYTGNAGADVRSC